MTPAENPALDSLDLLEEHARQVRAALCPAGLAGYVRLVDFATCG
ncbi:MAG: hypothetical protein ACRDZ8_07250 [Acidimicrobiales bacterium]